MNSLDFEDLPAISPLHLFAISVPCFYMKEFGLPKSAYLLPTNDVLTGGRSFAEVYAAWNEGALYFHFEVNAPFQVSDVNDFRKGDSIELFIDTRDLKTKGIVSRFCHHFVFFADPCIGKEVTRFRGDENHPLAISEELTVSSQTSKRGKYTVSIEIPSSSLYGYNPTEVAKVGFTYRINRGELPPQYFVSSGEESSIEQHPMIWGSLILEKK
jgi:hypothetical protein